MFQIDLSKTKFQLVWLVYCGKDAQRILKWKSYEVQKSHGINVNAGWI